VSSQRRRLAAATAGVIGLALAGAWIFLATTLLPWLPTQVIGDDYSAVLTSGIGPAVEALTVAALVAMGLATRGRRSVLDLWIMTALAFLVLDNALTLAGGTRGSIGWTAGRLLALGSAGAVIWAYLHEVDSLRTRAELALEGLAATEEKLRAAQKMEAVGQLTGGIAHDFNNLLMVVTSGFDMIRRRPDDRARVIKMAEAGLQATERGARLTRQLLSFARRQPLRPETVNPNTQLLDFEPIAARAAGETVEMIFDLDPAVHPVKVDQNEFEAAVLNLVVNARDALTPQGGHITVTSRNRIVMAAAADGAIQAGGYVVVSVTDDGRGMPPDVAQRAFEPFFTTKDFGSGSGLGLSQVYGFARAAGGEAVIRTEHGHGTTVELWLPRAAALRSKRAMDNRDQHAQFREAREGEVVLAVEDEPDVLAAVVENLADLGYQVLSARDGVEALELLREADRVDLLFSDIVMPGGMNGVQLATEAIRLFPNLRVLLTSGYTNQALEGQHDLPPNLDILPKPYRRAELASRLQLVMRAA
jgi:signal transduction histidine kinase/CheY-like chemotaxis protein